MALGEAGIRDPESRRLRRFFGIIATMRFIVAIKQKQASKIRSHFKEQGVRRDQLLSSVILEEYDTGYDKQRKNIFVIRG